MSSHRTRRAAPHLQRSAGRRRRAVRPGSTGRLPGLSCSIAVALLLAGGCSSAPLERDDVVRAREPVQAEVAARLDRLGLPVRGTYSGAVCMGGQDNGVIRDPYEFMCSVQEVRVVEVAKGDLGRAWSLSRRALRQVCGHSDGLSEDASAGADTRTGQLSCDDLVLDLLLARPGSPAIRASSLFRPEAAPGATAAPDPPGLDEASRAEVPYVLLLQGSQDFYREDR